MTEKKFTLTLFIVLIVLIVGVYVKEASYHSINNRSILFSYTYANEQEARDYIDKGIDNFTWTEEEFGTKKLAPTDEKILILKLHFAERLDKNKQVYIRTRNKVVELYVDGTMLQRNGRVATGDLKKELITYYELNIPFAYRYEGGEAVILVEAPNSIDITNLEKAEIISKIDFFGSYVIKDLVLIFALIISIFIALLTALNLYWIRYNFGVRLYKAFLLVAFICFALIFYTPYLHVTYPKYTELFSAIGFSSAVIIQLIFIYVIRGRVNNKYIKTIANITTAVVMVIVLNLIYWLSKGIINWSYAQYVIGVVTIILTLPCTLLGYRASEYVDKVFSTPLRVYFISSTVVLVVVIILYIIGLKSSTTDIIYNVVLYLIATMLVLVSYIINNFHAYFFSEVQSVAVEQEIYEHIEFSREARERDILGVDRYNNFDIEYVKSIIQNDIYATSLILKYNGSNDTEVLYAENNFGKTRLTRKETNFYMTLYNDVFKNSKSNAISNGKQIYLGFKQDNLYYFMAIRSQSEIAGLKLQALETYVSSIKNTAQNYVITTYVEKARNDVIKSFGKSIEDRVEGYNIIGITDKIVVFIARSMNKSEQEVQILKTASYLKNIGSIIMSESDIRDYNSMSDEQIRESYKRADYGYDILKKFDDVILLKAANISKYQFEYYDGSGLHGLKGEAIPDEGKIMILAVFMTSAFRNGFNKNTMFEDVVNYVETRFEGKYSPYVMGRCKQNYYEFDDILLENEEEFTALVDQLVIDYRENGITDLYNRNI